MAVYYPSSSDDWRRVVVDPHLLVGAYAHKQSKRAKFLALLVYGRLCEDASSEHLEAEIEAVKCLASEIASQVDKARLEREIAAAVIALEEQHRDARAYKEDVERAFNQTSVPGGLLLVWSVPLAEELYELAQESQEAGNELLPHLVKPFVAELATHAFVDDEELSRVGFRGWRTDDREHVIQTAVAGNADSVITEDSTLLGEHTVSTYTLAEFLEMAIPDTFNFGAFNAPAVWKAASRFLPGNGPSVPSRRRPPGPT